MEEIAISKFKATCLSVLDRVAKTKKPILVTKFGKPVAQVGPPPIPARPANWMGSFKGTVQILGDIVSPVADEEDWEVLRD
jgi:prevent-host-death family protein